MRRLSLNRLSYCCPTTIFRDILAALFGRLRADRGNASGTALYRGSGRLLKPRPGRPQRNAAITRGRVGWCTGLVSGEVITGLRAENLAAFRDCPPMLELITLALNPLLELQDTPRNNYMATIKVLLPYLELSKAAVSMVDGRPSNHKRSPSSSTVTA